LARSGEARIVSVSSNAHRRSPIVFEDIHFERRPYEPWSAYGPSKTAERPVRRGGRSPLGR
jgi:hypothetical protein